MPRYRKRSGIEASKPIRESKRQRAARTDAEDSTHDEASSISPDVSDSEVTLVNSEGAVDLEVWEAYWIALKTKLNRLRLNDSVKNAQKALEQNRSRAQTFEAIVAKQQTDLHGEIEAHKAKLVTNQGAFEDALRSTILSALKPLTAKDVHPRSRNEFAIRASDANPQDRKFFKDTELLCQSMTSLLSIYMVLAKRSKPDSRSRIARDSLNKDKDSVTQLIIAGTRSAKQGIKSRLANESSDSTATRLSDEDERNAILFRDCGGKSSVHNSADIGEWKTFKSELADAVQKIRGATKSA